MKTTNLFFGYFLAFVSASNVCFGQSGSTINIVADDPRPLAEAISQLEQQLQIAINYEDVPYSYSGDSIDVTSKVMSTAQRAEHPAARIRIPRGGQLSLSVDSPPVPNTLAAESIVNSLVQSNNLHGYTGIYEASSLNGSLFVMPAQMRNTSGSLVAANRALDTAVTIPAQLQNAGQILDLVLNEVSRVTKTQVGLGQAPFGALSNSEVLIGADNESARSVLARLLASLSSRTLVDGSVVPQVGYQLFCDPNGVCMFNIHVIRPATNVVIR